MTSEPVPDQPGYDPDKAALAELDDELDAAVGVIPADMIEQYKAIARSDPNRPNGSIEWVEGLHQLFRWREPTDGTAQLESHNDKLGYWLCECGGGHDIDNRFPCAHIRRVSSSLKEGRDLRGTL